MVICETEVMKKAALFALLILLALFEVSLCGAFLPLQWQRAFDDGIRVILPKSHDWTPITHPLLSQEIEQVLREHTGLRIVFYVITVALLVGNAWLIRSVWRFLRGLQRKSES
jgi:hypothetical protein